MTSAPRWTPIAVAATAAVVTAGLGGLLTDIGPWYRALKQPAWKPPDWAFGPIWTTIFALCAVAGVRAWRRARSRAERTGVVALFAVNAVLNVLWSLLYFHLQRPDWALVEVPFLWLSVLALVVFLARLSRAASLLLLPYLVWVGLAAVLNWHGVELNGPFVAR